MTEEVIQFDGRKTVTVYDWFWWGQRVECALDAEFVNLARIVHPKEGYLMVIGRDWLKPFGQRPEHIREAQALAIKLKKDKKI